MKKIVVFMILVIVMIFTGCGNMVNDEVKEDKHNEIVSNEPEKNSASEEDNTEDEANEGVKEDDESKLQVYLDKYIQLEKDLKDSLESKYGGTTIDMREAAGIEHSSWDDFLNEIYGVLQEQLSEEDMDVLREEQIAWLTIRDSKAEESANEVKGGTMEPLVYVMTLGQTTKERCYKLIINYMK